ncbi:DUF2066 domain-containing protein [Microbulbifer thermotolerans]|uniref:DUF2066 domain-containing protein n=1 Tax=Microbulbifer thermotolerans TaxID=252514 RepID=UPI002248D2D4|nr:DUF2066 domain-containing protein [Microbulbifer thermotolerans]MCX2779910.1 DUF2066 domain-containing protein [Microbulbifer thermotolerans]MCX2805217.1 DUF2066 domain-containing protein [Microbulbifer thermotolerans]MCX2830919.1 DUF2066 domain-containing protein [Microbulbifer thermotolerans]
MRKLLRHGLASKVLALLMCALILPAQARVIPDLYEVVEAVPSRGAMDRASASSRGLERVFVRVTGDATIGDNPQLKTVLERAQQYLQGYRYTREDNQLYLHLSFDPQAVSDQVHTLGLPMWPNNRPATLVWVAVDTLQQGRSALREEQYPELYAALEAMALERGLPVDFPVMDLNDQRNMPLGNLWALDERAAERASVRYGPDATLMGRLLEVSGERWQASWLLIHGGRSYAFDASGTSLEEVALRGIDEAANLMAQRYAVRPSGDSGPRGTVIVEISGIDSFADYTEASAYLQGLAQVSSADLLSVDSDRMRLALTTSATLQKLHDALALNRKLEAGADSDPIDLTGYRAPLGSADNPLHYRWH